MSKKRICISRIRSSDKYIPNKSIVDSCFYLLLKFMEECEDYNYSFYRVSFSNNGPPKNLMALKESDVIVIPSEQEWCYHIKGKLMNIQVKNSNAELEKIREVIEGKKVIILSQDRADTIRLFREKTFPGLNLNYRLIDEDEFPGGLTAIRHYFLQKIDSSGFEKVNDFSYWGTSKKKKVSYDDDRGELSGDERHEYFKKLHKDNELSTCFIGTFDGFDRDIKFSKNFETIATHVASGRATICFNWLGADDALTARYHEALAFDVIPLVWHRYDVNNRLVADEWQRCYSYEDIKTKLKELRDEDFRKEKLDLIKSKYYDSIVSLEDYVSIFKNKLIKAIEE